MHETGNVAIKAELPIALNKVAYIGDLEKAPKSWAVFFFGTIPFSFGGNSGAEKGPLSLELLTFIC